MVQPRAVGLQPRQEFHILTPLYQQLQALPFIIVQDTDKSSASTCTEAPLLSKSRRIIRERRQVALGARAYAIVDELRLNSIIDTEEIRENLSNVRSSIHIIEAYISIRNNPRFIQLREQQLRTASEILTAATKRLKYMDNVEYYKPTILSYLFKEVLLMDRLTELDMKVEQFCISFGVSGVPFAEAGKLVGRVWGATAKSLFKEIGKE